MPLVNSNSTKKILFEFPLLLMFTDDLFKKLRPILGDELYPLQSVYIAGDDEDKRNVERVLRVVYSNVITGIHPPPDSISSGKYPLGAVISGNKALHPFSLRDEDFFHIGIFGQTGRGKTNAMLHLLQLLIKNNIPWLVFDWKRAGYRDLIPEYDVHVFTVGRDVSPFHLNPLAAPPGVDRITWYKQFIQCISHAYFLGHGCEIILQDVIGRETPTLTDILKKLQVYPAKWRKLQWLQSTERAVKALCYGGISDVLNVENSPPITNWLSKNTVLELDALTDSEAKFFVNIVMSQIYFYRKEHRHHGLRHVSVIEEAHNVLKKETRNEEAKSVMDKIFREIREYGESIIIIDQMPSTILDSAFANTATQITLSLKHSFDVKAAGSAMLLDRDEQLFLGKLPVGTAIVKLQNRWHAPFMLRLPLVRMETGKTTDEAIADYGRRNRFANKTQNYSNQHGSLNSLGCSAQNRPEQPPLRKSGETTPVLETGKKGKTPGEMEILMMADIARNPLISVRERYKKLKLSAYLGDKCQKALLSQGLVKPVRIRTRKGVMKLTELTDRSRETLKKHGFTVSKSPRHGGVEHLYWLKQVKKKLESKGYKVKVEHPIGNGETVDLTIIGKKKKIAIEIETGKSDALHNIRKCLKAGFEVVSMATSRDALKKTKSLLRQLSESERQHVRVGRA